MMETIYCLDCKKKTEVVDHTVGDTICTECGLVLEAYYIDETSEWRAFADDSEDRDPNRVGSPTNPLLSHGNLTTIISKPNGAKFSSLPVLWQDNSDRTLIKGFKSIATMADKLGLNAMIKNRASEIYKKVEDHKSCCRARNLNAIYATCLLIAGRELKWSRTLKEISTVTEGTTMKEINRASEVIKKHVEVQTGTVNAGELVRRFCSNLCMSNQGVKAVQEAVKKSEEFNVRRSPKSVLAAIIYMITQLSDQKSSLKDISMAADVVEGTIKKTYKDLCPYASRLIPNWYAKEEDLKRICKP